jgi:hypothetical protein
VTEYGRAYEIYSPNNDAFRPLYVDMGPTPIVFDEQKYTIAVPV